VIIYLRKEVYQKRGVGCFVDMGVADYGYGCGCGKIPCIYIIKMAAAYRGIGGICCQKNTPVATLQHYSYNKILPIIDCYRKYNCITWIFVPMIDERIKFVL
jgi:hypothetical protein